MTHTFQGAWPALITPTAADGGVDLAALQRLVGFLLGKGVDGLYLCGSTGEGVLLSVAERQQLVEAVTKQVGGQIPIIVHVGSNATRHAVELAHHAQAAGCDGISAILPTVAQGVEETYRHYGTIASAAPDLPFFPYLFGGQLDAVSLMAGLLERVPNVAGAKYTGPSMYELRRIVALRDGNWTVFSGMDEQCLFGALSGAPGNIGSTLNVMPGIYGEIHRHHRAGAVDRALALQHRANRVTEVLIEYGFHGALREAMRMVGIDCGTPRLPHLALAQERKESFRQALVRADFKNVVAL